MDNTWCKYSKTVNPCQDRCNICNVLEKYESIDYIKTKYREIDKKSIEREWIKNRQNKSDKLKITWEQGIIYNILKELEYNPIIEYWDEHKHIDIAIIQSKLYIECDDEKHLQIDIAIADNYRDYYSYKDGYYTFRVPYKRILQKRKRKCFVRSVEYEQDIEFNVAEYPMNDDLKQTDLCHLLYCRNAKSTYYRIKISILTSYENFSFYHNDN